MLQHRAVTENYLRQQKIQKHCSIRETSPVSHSSARLFGTKYRYVVAPLRGVCVCLADQIRLTEVQPQHEHQPHKLVLLLQHMQRLQEPLKAGYATVCKRINVRALNVEACQMWKLGKQRQLTTTNLAPSVCPLSHNQRLPVLHRAQMIGAHTTERSGRWEMQALVLVGAAFMSGGI